MAVRIAGVIHVPDVRLPPFARGAAQPAVTSANALSRLMWKPPLRIRFARLRLTLSDCGRSTARGSGDHQRMGEPGPYQGKMPAA